MKRMQLNDSVKRRRSSPIKTSIGSSGDAALRPTLVAFPVTSSSELTSDIPRSVSHDPHVVGLPQPMSTSASRTPSANSAFLQQNSELKNQKRLSGSWAPEVGCDKNIDEAYRQQDRYPSTEMERNNSPKRCPTPWRNDDGGENGNAADKRPSLTTSAEIRDSTVHLKYGGYPEVILDGSKPPCTTVNAEKELDVENQSLVETVRIQGSGCGRTGDSAGHGLGQRVGFIEKIQVTVHGFIDRNRSHIFHAIIAVFVALFYAYLFVAVWYYIGHDYDTGILPIVAMTVFVMVVLLLRFIGRRFGDRIEACVCWPFRQPRVANTFKYFKWCFYLAVFIGLCVFVAVDIGADVKRLTSLGGMAIFLTIGFLTSTNPSKVRWRPVLWGLGLQFVLGVLILRWQPGYEFFRIMGDGVRVFLEYADEGSKFVFGEEGLTLHPMAFKVFPIIIYFSAVINIFYYWGLMQFVVCKIAWLMQFTMGTTAIESLNAACNIFIGMAESCVIMRPFLPKLTKSELHAVMTGGFATVAGSYIALLIQVGASPEHLLSAAIMSAPAALAMAKLSYPETEISHTRTEEDVKIENLSARNMVEAASNGAISAIKVVSSVAANLIALLGLIAFLDAALLYIGNTVGIESLSFKMMCSYIFWPLAVIMGVEIDDAFNVARLIGVKIFADEFISFQELATMVCDKSIQDRSMVIATYACCGFGSIAAIGVYIGAMISVAPERRGDITEVAFRAVVNGNVAGFLTACIAGILYTGSSTLAAPGAQAIGCASNATLLATMNVTMHGMAHA